MNERIKLLAGKALDKAVPYTWTTLSYDEVTKLQEKFAELIVKECAKIADSNDYGSTDEWDLCARNISRNIKEHFGVEE